MITVFSRYLPFATKRRTHFKRYEHSPAQLDCSSATGQVRERIHSQSRYGRIVFFFSVYILVSPLVWTPLQASDFEAGLKAYHEFEYEEAAKAFERALKSEESGAVQHNLALCDYQLDQPAKAVWRLERALRLDPFNESYLFKLGALRQQLGLPAAPKQWLQNAARILPQGTWIWIVSLCAWLLIAATVLPRISGKHRTVSLKLLMGLSVIIILIALTALSILTLQQASGVIVSEETVALHHAPASAAPEAGLARPGERIRLLESHGNFLKIETEAQITGWVEKDALVQL